MGGKVWVVVQQREGVLHRMSNEALAAGQELAGALGGEVEAVVVGAKVGGVAGTVATAELAAVRVIDRPQLASYTPGAFVGVLRPAIEAAAVDYVLFPHTYQTVDFVPRLAQALGGSLVPEVTGFAVVDGEVRWQRPVLGGKLESTVRVKGPNPVLVSVQSGAFSSDALRAGSALVEELAVDEAPVADREILGVEQAAGEQVDLTAAEMIVAVGRGIGDGDKLGIVRELAEALGAELAASRPVVDNGWLPRDRQIGSSGQTVAPKLYVAVGISGAIQHLVGMKGSKVVVAINRDAGAPIFGVASYGIVGDLHEIVPAFTEALKARG